jgi:hypothetical protein
MVLRQRCRSSLHRAGNRAAHAPVDENLASIHTVNTGHDFNGVDLPAPFFAHQGLDLARTNVETDTFQYQHFAKLLYAVELHDPVLDHRRVEGAIPAAC